VPDRHFPALADFFLEPQHVLRPVVLEVTQPQPRYRPGPLGLSMLSVWPLIPVESSAFMHEVIVSDNERYAIPS
jgi:hypothetical protein